jgi:hypothetical protein
MRKQIFNGLLRAVALAMTLFLAFVTISSTFAQSGTTGPLTWNINNGTLTISGEGAMPDYGFSNNFAPWREYQASIHTVIIETGVTTIGNYAFYPCTSLTSITISDGVTSIGRGAFRNCKSLSSITIPNSVITVGSLAFLQCFGLTSITFSNNLATIGDYAFEDCTNLTSITLPDGLTSIGDYAFNFCTGLSSITIPNSVTTIGMWAFSNCESMTSAVLPNNITSISDYIFNNCYSLVSISIPNSVTKIGSWAFAWCNSLPSITLPTGITTIKDHTFTACFNLTSIIIPEGVKSIGSTAFYWCNSLTSITIPNNVITIGDAAFACCYSLTSINVESENNRYVSEDGVLFNINKNTLVCYPGGKTGNYGIPNSVTTIGIYAFAGCKSLISVTIPNGVKSIENMAFYECENLTSITNLNLVPVTINSNVFGRVNQSDCTLKVPTSAVAAYQSANVWEEFNIAGGGILVNPVANNSIYGYTIGDGLYQDGDIADVMAVANEGYKFVNWTKGGIEISKNNPYSFMVIEDVELVANFEKDDTGIVETDNYPSVQIYPNPASCIVNNAAATEIEQLNVFDITGRLVSSQSPASHQVTFDTGVLPKGVYLVRALLRDGGVQTGKVVVR